MNFVQLCRPHRDLMFEALQAECRKQNKAATVLEMELDVRVGVSRYPVRDE